MDHLVSKGIFLLPSRRIINTYCSRADILGVHTLSERPHFLWVTQFPLFTRADEDKEHLAKGRWSATHHPFTAPMFEDLEDLKQGKVEAVSLSLDFRHASASRTRSVKLVRSG